MPKVNLVMVRFWWGGLSVRSGHGGRSNLNLDHAISGWQGEAGTSDLGEGFHIAFPEDFSVECGCLVKGRMRFGQRLSVLKHGLYVEKRWPPAS